MGVFWVQSGIGYAPNSDYAAGANGALFGNWQLLGAQIIAVLVTAIYAFVMTYGLLKLLSLRFTLRVAVHEEKKGLDLSVHGEPGYRF